MKHLMNILGLASCLAYAAKADDSAASPTADTETAAGKAAKEKAALNKAAKAAANQRAKEAAAARANPSADGKVTVRVKGSQPISEGGQIYLPAERNPRTGDVIKPAATFQVTPERFGHLRHMVELVED